MRQIGKLWLPLERRFALLATRLVVASLYSLPRGRPVLSWSNHNNNVGPNHGHSFRRIVKQREHQSDQHQVSAPSICSMSSRPDGVAIPNFCGTIKQRIYKIRQEELSLNLDVAMASLGGIRLWHDYVICRGFKSLNLAPEISPRWSISSRHDHDWQMSPRPSRELHFIAFRDAHCVVSIAAGFPLLHLFSSFVKV